MTGPRAPFSAPRTFILAAAMLTVTACGEGAAPDAPPPPVDSAGAGGAGTGGAGGGTDCADPAPACAARWEQNAADRFDELSGTDSEELRAFLRAVPKGGDLHNHLTGSVYAETMLAWAAEDGNCIHESTHVAVFPSQCSSQNLPVPAPGPFFDAIVGAWSMEGFVAGAETGHDHFFATFGKFGLIAGYNRWQSVADIAARAASENQLYIETMFNLGRTVGELSTDIWAGTLTTADLPGLYADIVAAPSFQAAVADDVEHVTQTYDGYRRLLDCDGDTPPPACDVTVRFTAQISRTGAKDMVFGQMISAFEMASRTPLVVAANLSSPEDHPTSINNYTLHMEMLDFLHEQYTVPGTSPLHITLHAGELTPEVLPVGSDANTFHIRQAIELGHAERIGHGLDVLSETNSAGLLAQMRERDVMVEVCLSSNIQILEVSGPGHPLSTYIDQAVPLALATDDQGVSRSSMAGEYARAALDQELGYLRLKTMARTSLEHAFVPGDSLWTSSSTDALPVPECAASATELVGEAPPPDCANFLATSEKARLQWALEGRFLEFERRQ